MTLRMSGTLCQVLEIRAGDRHENSKKSDSAKAPACVLLQNLRTGERKLTTYDALNLLAAKGQIYPVELKPQESLVQALTRNDAERNALKELPLGGESVAAVRAVVEKIRWTRALDAHGWTDAVHKLTPLDIEFMAAKHELPIRDTRTLATWVAQSRANDLVPDFSGRGGAGKHRGDAQAHEILDEVIEAIKIGALPEVAPLPKAVHDEVQRRIIKINEALPQAAARVQMFSISTAARALDAAFTPYEKVLFRKGKAAADLFARATGTRPVAGAPGLICEFDDTDSKTFCISRATGLAWGRPWITYGVDQFSGYPMGRAFGREHRSATSALECIVNCIEYKPPFKGFNDADLVWDSVGYFAMGVFDNALYNNDRIIGLELNVDRAWTRPRMPTDKREVEYLNGRTKIWASTQPGFRGARDDKDALKLGIGTAVLYLEEFDQRHITWLLGDYANAPMEKTGRSRHQLYMEIGELQMRPRYPVDVRRLQFLRMVPLAKPLTWTRNGIKYGHLLYQNEEQYRRLVTWPGAKNKLPVRVGRTMEFIYVTMPDGELIPLRCLEEEYARGLTQYAHKVICKMLAETRHKNPSLKQLWDTRDKLRTMTSQQSTSGKVRERQKAERVGTLPDPVRSVEAVHDVQVAYEQLDLITLDTNDEDYVLAEDI